PAPIAIPPPGRCSAFQTVMRFALTYWTAPGGRVSTFARYLAAFRLALLWQVPTALANPRRSMQVVNGLTRELRLLKPARGSGGPRCFRLWPGSWAAARTQRPIRSRAVNQG